MYSHSTLITNDHTFDTARPFIKHISISVDVNNFDQTHACLQNAISILIVISKKITLCNKVSTLYGK